MCDQAKSCARSVRFHETFTLSPRLVKITNRDPLQRVTQIIGCCPLPPPTPLPHHPTYLLWLDRKTVITLDFDKSPISRSPSTTQHTHCCFTVIECVSIFFLFNLCMFCGATELFLKYLVFIAINGIFVFFIKGGGQGVGSCVSGIPQYSKSCPPNSPKRVSHWGV
jgi:hypothetical protein